MRRIGLSGHGLVISGSNTREKHIDIERRVYCLKRIRKKPRCKQGMPDRYLKQPYTSPQNSICGFIFGPAIEYEVQTLGKQERYPQYDTNRSYSVNNQENHK